MIPCEGVNCLVGFTAFAALEPVSSLAGVFKQLLTAN